VPAFDQALTINPRFEPALYYKGVAFEQMGRGNEAQALYSEAIADARSVGKLDGYYASDHFIFGLLALKTRQPQTAEMEFAIAKHLGYTAEAPYLK